MPTTICSECGGEGECFCREVGGTDRYEDEYIFVCKKNEHIVKKTIPGGSTTGENWSTICPFCKNSNGEHSLPPKGIQ